MKDWHIKKRILLVDDAPAFTQVIQRHLESSGNYEVRAEEGRGRPSESSLRFAIS